MHLSIQFIHMIWCRVHSWGKWKTTDNYKHAQKYSIIDKLRKYVASKNKFRNALQDWKEYTIIYFFFCSAQVFAMGIDAG